MLTQTLEIKSHKYTLGLQLGAMTVLILHVVIVQFPYNVNVNINDFNVILKNKSLDAMIDHLRKIILTSYHYLMEMIHFKYSM